MEGSLIRLADPSAYLFISGTASLKLYLILGCNAALVKADPFS
ncbi:MAG: hypothetical protein AB7K24_16955 [Gemmataceae bacterium]